MNPVGTSSQASNAASCRLLSTLRPFSNPVCLSVLLLASILQLMSSFQLAGNLDTALTLYKKAQSGGIERAAQNVRNVSAKLLGQKVAEQEKKAE